MFLEMIDIGHQIKSVDKKHLESEKSYLEDWEHETKEGRKMGAFFSRAFISCGNDFDTAVIQG